MSPILLVLASIFLLLLAVCYLRMPIGLLLTLLGFIGYAMLDGVDRAFGMLGNEFWSTFSSTGLMVVPLFVFMGQICFHSGLSRRLYQAVAAFAGHKKGGIAAATLVACAGFSAICGSNTATAATMSAVALPEMDRYRYHPSFAAGLVACGTTLGAVIPPSVVAIVLGIQTGISIQKLFLGGILPGILLLLLFLLIIVLVAFKRPELVPSGERASKEERIRCLPGIIEAVVLFSLVVGGLTSGLFTPTEAGAAGAALALLIGFFRKKIAKDGLSLRAAFTAALESMNISAMIFLLLAGAGCYGKFLALSRAPFMVSEWVQATSLPPLALLLLILVVYLIGGMIMDALALLLITLPIFFPLATSLQYDPVIFCLLLLVVTTLGAITPPVGASAYVVSSMGKIPLGSVFRGTILFLPAYFLCLLVMLLLPSLFLLLPNIVR